MSEGVLRTLPAIRLQFAAKEMNGVTYEVADCGRTGRHRATGMTVLLPSDLINIITGESEKAQAGASVPTARWATDRRSGVPSNVPRRVVVLSRTRGRVRSDDAQRIVRTPLAFKHQITRFIITGRLGKW